MTFTVLANIAGIGTTAGTTVENVKKDSETTLGIDHQFVIQKTVILVSDEAAILRETDRGRESNESGIAILVEAKTEDRIVSIVKSLGTDRAREEIMKEKEKHPENGDLPHHIT